MTSDTDMNDWEQIIKKYIVLLNVYCIGYTILIILWKQILKLKQATHLAILYADRSELDRQRISPLIDAGTLGNILRRSRRFDISISFPDYNQVIFSIRAETSCDKIAQPDWLTLVAISSDERKRSQEQAHLANAGEFNHRYLTCQISAILYADCGNRPSLHLAHLAIFANCCDRHIKLAGVSPALPVANFNGFNIKVRPQYINICIQIKSSLG